MGCVLPFRVSSVAYGPIGLVLLVLVAAIVWVLPSYYTGLITLIGLYALVAIGLNLFMGYAGQVSLGQAAFFGVGAYTSATLAVKAGVSPWFGMVHGAAVAALVAYALSFVALRLRENLLALATLALGIVINVVFNQWDFIGGSSGLKDIPGFTLGAYVFDQRAYAILAWALRRWACTPNGSSARRSCSARCTPARRGRSTPRRPRTSIRRRSASCCR
jgi:branched-chain amino acid transport system permease protein